MRISQFITVILLFIYQCINKMGLFKLSWVRAIFVKSYFIYKNYYEDAYAKFVKKYPHLFQTGHILDIGANIGYTAYVFSKVLTSPYKIFAFEPEVKNLNILQKVAKSYGFLNNIVIIEAAIGDKESEVFLWKNKNNPADHRILTQEFRQQLKKPDVQKTTLITIDGFLKKNNILNSISFIKIDVQGYEWAVCQGMQETLSANPNCVIAFEYSPPILKTLGFDPDKLIQFFQDKKYFFYKLNKNGVLTLLESTLLQMTTENYFDIVCAKNRLI